MHFSNFFQPLLTLSIALLVTPTFQNTLLPRAGTNVICENKFLWQNPSRYCLDQNQNSWDCEPKSCYIQENYRRRALDPSSSSLYFYNCREPKANGLVDAVRVKSYEILQGVDISISDGFVGKKHIPDHPDITYLCQVSNRKNQRRVGCGVCYPTQPHQEDHQCATPRSTNSEPPLFENQPNY
ncbi:hypothetical protein O181_038038 [Austropuccinia psidii MF-1]|uniref:Secreted protein n=1 Tax=Austropuccinia psidii MF-1 TaxID=1389203 RepID=A0A9Q3HAN5_9BASI|nr:hypothetical protein [Austropuccinia psidii MF-1]